MRIVCDIEANGLRPNVSQVWCVVGKDIDTGEVSKFRPDEVEAAKKYLSRAKVVIGHNFIDYDIPVLKDVWGFEFPEDTFVYDTYIVSQMVDPDRRKHPALSGKKGPHSLENFGLVFKRKKPEHEDWTKFSEDMLHRCAEDVEINYLTYKMLERKAQILSKSKWTKPYKLEAAFAKCLVKQKEHGFLVNKDKIHQHIDYLTSKIDEIDSELVPSLPKQLIIKEQKVAGVLKYNQKPFKGDGNLNQRTVEWCDRVGYQDRSIIGGPFSRIEITDFPLGSVGVVKDYLLEQGWVPEQWNYKEDPITKDKMRTSPKLSKTDPFLGVKTDMGWKVAERMIYRHRRSQLEGFLKIIRPDDRITANVTGITPTCRLKHSGIVNIPGEDAVFGPEMREVFIAPDGYRIVGCDAKSCQLRNLCHHMKDDEYTAAVVSGSSEDGTDVHSVNMRKTGITVRRDAKGFIYGFLFGAGDGKIASILGSTNSKDGKRVKAQFLKELPTLKQLIDKVTLQFETYGYITGLDGREVYPRSGHECLCYLLQSDEAILMKAATCYAHKWIEDEGLDAYMVCHMHDEYQWEVREEHSERVAELLAKAIVKAGEWFKMTVPMGGDAKIGNNWKDTH